jgi:hypothetical protein
MSKVAAWILLWLSPLGLNEASRLIWSSSEYRQDLGFRLEELHCRRLLLMLFFRHPPEICLEVSKVAVHRNRADALFPQFGDTLRYGYFGFSRSTKRLESALARDDGFGAYALKVYSFLDELGEAFPSRTQRLKFCPVRSKLLILRLA